MQLFGRDPYKPRTFRVLLAEDSPINRVVVESALAQAGHLVTSVANGAQAVKQMSEESFDAVVMDVEMPVMDGLTASRAIRELETKRGGHVPIIALTANTENNSAESYLAAGMDVYLRKPFDINVLLQTIEEVMEPVLEVFNRAELLERVGGDETLLTTIIGVFRSDATNMLDAIRDAVAANNPHAVERAAHKLKGALANLSAATAMQVAKVLEDMGRHGVLANAEGAYKSLTVAMDTLDSRLRAIR
jgi:two-component system, sensor histidine kinase and response regulator